MSLLSPPLQAFMAIVKKHTVHAAATELHLTQTAVTQRIRSLEKQLQTTLFVRSRRGMTLTSEGEALYHYCQGVIELEGEALAKITGAGVDSLVNICISGPSSIMHTRILPAVSSVIKSFPQCRIQFDMNDAGDVMQSLRLGHCQFAVLPDEQVSREVKSKSLVPENYVLVASSSWKERKLKEILQSETIIDFNPQDIMTFNYLKFFDLYQYANHDRHYANRPESLARLIVDGLGYGVLTEELCQPFVERGEMILLNQQQLFVFQHSLVWYERPEPPKYFQQIIDSIS